MSTMLLEMLPRLTVVPIGSMVVTPPEVVQVASAQVFDTASLFVGVLVLAIGGYLGVELLRWVETKMAPWRHFEFKD